MTAIVRYLLPPSCGAFFNDRHRSIFAAAKLEEEAARDAAAVQLAHRTPGAVSTRHPKERRRLHTTRRLHKRFIRFSCPYLFMVRRRLHKTPQGPERPKRLLDRAALRPAGSVESVLIAELGSTRIDSDRLGARGPAERARTCQVSSRWPRPCLRRYDD